MLSPTSAAGLGIGQGGAAMKNNKSGFSWPLLLIGIPFAALSLIALGLALWQITNHVRAQSWVEHPAVLQSLRSEDAPSIHLRIRHPSRLEGSYTYTIDGRDYVSTQITFSRVHTYGLEDWDDSIAEALGEPGAAITIWVNPSNPAESVAIRDMRWDEFGAYLLFALGMGAGGILFLTGAFGRGGPPLPPNTPPPRVKLGTVIVMWLLTPLFGVLAWLLWRDGHGVWAGVVSLQILLTLNASYQYGVHRLARSRQGGA